MAVSQSKTPLFQEHRIPTEGSDSLHATIMLPKPPIFPKRLVLIPPLVGARASQGLILSRNLARRGSILLSFEYCGHPRSTGTFELDKTILDTQCALHWADDYARQRGLPLHALAMCYGAVALMALFRRGNERCPLWSLSTVSGLFRMDRIIRFEDFAPRFSDHVGIELDSAMQSPEISDNVDWQGDRFRGALREYLTGIFPGLRVGHDHFEELQYDRVDVRRTLRQLSAARYLDSVTIPREVPCNVVYGRNDKVMSLDTPQGRDSYRKRASELIPHAVFHQWEVDHFAQGPDREALIDQLGDFFEESEARAVDLTDRSGRLQETRR